MQNRIEVIVCMKEEKIPQKKGIASQCQSVASTAPFLGKTDKKLTQTPSTVYIREKSRWFQV